LPVYIFVGTPEVAPANKGYRFVAVVVSLLIEAPETTVAQLAAVPLVVRYFPLLLACEGRASTVPQDVAVPSVVKYLPLLPV